MDILEIKRHILIIDRCDKLLLLLNNDENIEIKAFKKKSVDIVNKYNNNNYTISNPSNREIGDFKSAMKKFITSKYGFSEIIYKLIDSTKFSDDLFNSYLALGRKNIETNKHRTYEDYKDEFRLGMLKRVMVDVARTTAQKEFYEKNKKVLTKHLTK